jgi:purine-cytosine permease-like protein
VAESYGGSAQDTQAARLRAWVLGISVTALAMFLVGVVLAVFIEGPARPWTGLAYVIAMGLAIVVGLSKTSSA